MMKDDIWPVQQTPLTEQEKEHYRRSRELTHDEGMYGRRGGKTARREAVFGDSHDDPNPALVGPDPDSEPNPEYPAQVRGSGLVMPRVWEVPFEDALHMRIALEAFRETLHDLSSHTSEVDEMEDLLRVTGEMTRLAGLLPEAED